jgi:hypothetical protein
MAKFEAARSEQARYLLKCVDVLRHLQRSRLRAATASYLDICRVEAGYIISGDYSKWGAK